MAEARPESLDHEVAWISHKHGDHCDKCGKEISRGAIIQANRVDGLRCGRCAGYADLSFLPSGDVRLTRLAKKLTSRLVVVVQWSRARKRHERQGILIDDDAYTAVLGEVNAGRSRFRSVDLGGGDTLLWKD